MKKKLLAILMAVAMTASLAACGGSKEEAASSAAAESEAPASEAAASEAPAEEASAAAEAAGEYETVNPGKLTVATSPDFAPYEFYAIAEDGTPTLSGFDMAFAQYLADSMGLELEIVTMDFDGVLAELAAGNVDLGMAGLSPSEERKSVMDFSDIYYLGGQSFVTVEANADKITDMAACNSSDFTIGAQTGSIQLELAQANTPDADIVSLPKVTDLISELLGGKMDAAFIETAVADSYSTNYPELKIVCDVPYDVPGSAIGVHKDCPNLLAAVNASIAAATADGSLDNYIAEANELASGTTYEGLLDENGQVQ